MAKRTRISDLAEVATCQRRVYLKAKYGLRETTEQAVAKQRGTELHDRAFKQSRPDSKAQDKRCFIATSVYGAEAAETEILRNFRDQTLLTNLPGRAFVRTYYTLSPGFVAIAERLPVVSKLSKKILDAIVERISQ